MRSTLFCPEFKAPLQATLHRWGQVSELCTPVFPACLPVQLGAELTCDPRWRLSSCASELVGGHRKSEINISKDIESVTQNFPTKKSPGSDGITGKFYLTFKEE